MPYALISDYPYIMSSMLLVSDPAPLVRSAVAYAARGLLEREAVGRFLKDLYEATTKKAYNSHELKHWVHLFTEDNSWEI